MSGAQTLGYVNRTFADWLGYAPAELIGFRTLADLGAAPDLPGADASFTCTLQARDGRPIPLRFEEALGTAPEREGTTFAVVRAVDEAGRGDDAIRHADPRFRDLYDRAPFGIALLDGECRIVQTNPVFLAILADAPSVVQARRFVDFIDAQDREMVDDLLHTASGGGAPSSHEVHLDRPGRRIVRLDVGRLTDSGDRDSGLIVYLVDVTQQKRLEEQFIQSQKLDTVGQLAGGIAHDFNNLLTAMIGFSDLLLLRHAPGDQSFADIMQIKQDANRAANLVRQLLAFSRQQTLKPTTLNLTDVLTELAHLLRRLLGENITLRLVHHQDLGLVKVDQGQLEQVVINLAVNARDAMPGGGILTISTGNVHFDAPTPLRHDTAGAGDYVLIEVADTGRGIADEHIDKIFEPFFSTKDVGTGTGLGLSTVYGIIKQTGGFIVPESMVDNGTTFRIYLPRFEPGDGAATADSAQAPTQDLIGAGTVLLVEDEAPVRMFAARALSSKGYAVLEADSGEAALEVLDDADQSIDVMVTDVVMPNMDGPTLVRTARRKRPDMKAILISGYAEEVFRRGLGDDEQMHFLPKPFTLKEMASMVKTVLEGDE